ncbi:hypothetical protein [Candidatus Magnetominusculus dajiuhuensis]|uniref:hypothetical protein n=1 Tax=Candidatus Magnetominusculus dajiuhuensis TaxID=3137712 RepID=UPI003B42BB01
MQKFTGICVIVLSLCLLALQRVEAADFNVSSGVEQPHTSLLAGSTAPVADNATVDPYYTAASTAITSLITRYSAFLGSPAGGIQTNTYGFSGNYYTQWFDNGMALMAWVDGSVYLYYNGMWQSLGTTWSSAIANVYLIFNTLIYQYSSFFGPPSGALIHATTSGGQEYYAMYFANGIVLFAAPDGNMYYYLGGTWKSIGMTWTTSS